MFTINAKLDPPGAAEASVAALRNAPYDIRRDAGAAIARTGREIASAASAKAVLHPSGLWRGVSAARYSVRKKSLLSVGVQATTGKAGRAEAMTEWAKLARSGQGRTLVSVLNRHYSRPGGSGGGRVLWAAYDEREDKYIGDVETAVSDYARRLQQAVNA